MAVAVAPAAGPLSVEGTTTAIEAINRARLGAGGPPLLLADMSQAWGGGWVNFAVVLETRTRRCRAFAAHRVPHRQLLVKAIREALPGAAGQPTPLVFSPRCRTIGIGFPAWALASALEVSVGNSFAAGLRDMLVEDKDDRMFRSLPEVARAARAWIKDAYNPGCGAEPLRGAA
jgi:hypothetical protein